MGQPPILLHEFFDQAAMRWPDRIAIDVPPASGRPARRVITYADLQGQCNALASFLADFVTDECVVAILLPRQSEHLYLAQLAVLKAGAAYTCIDPLFPDEQIRAILDDSQAVAVLGDVGGLLRARRAKPDVECFLDVIDWAEGAAHDVSGLGTPLTSCAAPWLTPNSLAYIIYTSGTTGRPKGVMIEHGSIANLVRGDLRTLGVNPEDRVGQSASCAYDSSVEETWFALAAGATLVVMDDETTRLGPDLIAWLRDERITMFCPAPTLLRATGCADPARQLPDLRLLHVGGEALPQDVADRWAPGRMLINDYGPTETTVTALRGRVAPGKPITIGRPVPGVKAHVLNLDLEPVEDGVQGELCLAGVALARGYMNAPELTAQKFPLHPRLGRIYRTGDLVHRDADGNFYCHGRMDAQVKIRGYRIELEAIEARLTECDGVRAAACRVQGEGGQQKIVAFVVPRDAAAPPCFTRLKEALGQQLPAYMVPAHFGLIEKLPTSVSGKLDRRALPVLNSPPHETNAHAMPPRTAMEEKLARVIESVLKLNTPVSVTDDFFNDLGGDSLSAAQVISRLRDDPATVSLTVRSLYETRTVAELAKRVRQPSAIRTIRATTTERVVGNPRLATLIQAAWFVLILMFGAPLAYLLTFEALPWLMEALGMAWFLLLSPLLGLAAVTGYVALTTALAVAAKRLLIGRYQPTRAPIWGSFYVRNWIVQQVARLVPWRLIEGTLFQQTVLRALGARIGRRVHIHRGVNLLLGGWDLLEIGDDVTLSQDASLQLVELEAGQIVVGPVVLGDGSTLGIRAAVAGHTVMEANTYLTALSFLKRGSRIQRGACWAGIPAQAAGQSPSKPVVTVQSRELSPAVYAVALFCARVALGLFESIPAIGLTYAFAAIQGIDAEAAAAWLFDPSLDAAGLAMGTLFFLAILPCTLIFQVIAARALGPVPPGVISRWSLAYLRVWLKTGLVESANHWLSGTLLWHAWLRAAGMKLGRGCELMTIIDTVPELVEIGADSFLADGIYLAGPRIHQGTVTLAHVRLGTNTYFGNNAVIGAGQTIPDNVLLGVNTVADDTQIKPGTSWFGQPPFELPRREILECDRHLTHTPMWLRYANRVFWEWLRFALPLYPLVLVLGWVELVSWAETAVSMPVLLLGVVPALDFALLACLCLFGLALKWALLGRVKPGVHPLWSCWCYRWEFHFMAWDLFTAGPLSALEGTLLLNAFLRAMGMRLGKEVALGSGFAYIIDHDMLEFEDGATVSSYFQAHTFEDRVLKIDRITIRNGATAGTGGVLLYGAEIGAAASVAPNSVVMKHERLLPGRAYVGCPTREDN